VCKCLKKYLLSNIYNVYKNIINVYKNTRISKCEKKRERERERNRERVTVDNFFTSVFSIAGSRCGPVGCDEAISRSRKTEVDFRRRGRRTGVAVAEVAGPIDSPR